VQRLPGLLELFGRHFQSGSTIVSSPVPAEQLSIDLCRMASRNERYPLFVNSSTVVVTVIIVAA
jgi:hypothetical protein